MAPTGGSLTMNTWMDVYEYDFLYVHVQLLHPCHLIINRQIMLNPLKIKPANSTVALFIVLIVLFSSWHHCESISSNLLNY